MTRVFVADDKFRDVIAALEARGGWTRHAHLSFPKPALRWTNYARVPWPRVAPLQVVNHLQHAVLFSQKDRLSALLRAYQARLEASSADGPAAAVVDAFYPRTLDLRRPDAWRELHKWAVYYEAVAVATRFSRRKGREASDQPLVRCAVAFLRAVLSDANFFRTSLAAQENTNTGGGDGDKGATTPGVDVEAAEWRRLAIRWTGDTGSIADTDLPLFSEADATREAASDLLEQLALRDPQLGAVIGGGGGGVDAEERARCVWICKPSNLSQGRGITLVRSLDELVAIASPNSTSSTGDGPDSAGQTRPEQHWVVQKYIERPLLCQGGRKFDIRQWVLVTALPPAARAYWYGDCYLRFCAQPFSLHTASSRHDRFAHLSNYSVQKDFAAAGDRCGEESSDSRPPFESMWSSEHFRDVLRETHGSNVWEDAVVPRMQAVARHTLRAVLPELRMVGKGFEWLGFDFLLDEELRVWLLEVNVSPDVSHSTRVTAELVPRATTDALSLVLDPPNEVSPDNRWLPLTL